MPPRARAAFAGSRTRSTPCCSISPPDRARRRGRHQVRHRVPVTGAADDAAAGVIALVHRQLAAGQDRAGGRGRQLGTHRHGRRQGRPTADRDALAIWIGDELTAEHGVVAPGYDEARATEHLRGDEVDLRVDVGIGSGEATVWTCDLTHGYIDINAGYRS
jgi:glutamate N-acetyltransferase / amino-acid N-acetyltransferase